MFKRRPLPDHLNVPWRVRDALILVVAWFGLQIVLGGVLDVVAIWVPVLKHFLQGAVHGDVVPSFVINLISIGIGFGILALYLRKYRVGWDVVGLRRVGILRTAKYLALILISFVVLANLALALFTLLPGFNADQPQINEFTGSIRSHQVLAFMALVLLPPIFEETIFRGFIFPAIAKRTGMIWGAILSSLLFGLAHGQANLFVYTSILGMLLCFMYVRLRSTVPGILLHMLNNYLAFLALLAHAGK